MGLIQPNFHLLKEVIVQTSFHFQIKDLSQTMQNCIIKCRIPAAIILISKCSYPTLPNI